VIPDVRVDLLLLDQPAEKNWSVPQAMSGGGRFGFLHRPADRCRGLVQGFAHHYWKNPHKA
jgi:hypothetical protein